MAETKDVVVEEAPVVEAPLETIILTTEFDTNGEKFGRPMAEDENGELVLTEVEVTHDQAVDLRRRQREFDRSERDRLIGRKFKVSPAAGGALREER